MSGFLRDVLATLVFFAAADLLCGIRTTEFWQAVVFGLLIGSLVVYGRETAHA